MIVVMIVVRIVVRIVEVCENLITDSFNCHLVAIV